MATTIVNPAPTNSDSNNNSSMGFFLAAAILIFFVLFLFIYILPYIQRGMGGVQMNIPNDINVNLKQSNKK